MADNTVLPGTGETYAAEERGGVKYQKVLIEASNSLSGSVDAFGRWRVSNPTTIFDSKLTNLDKAPLLWDESLESGAGITASTPTAAKPYIDFSSTINTAGKLTRQTFRRFNYQPGKSLLVLMTGVLNLSGGGTGVERRIGYFDDNNGAFFEDNAGVYGVTVRTNDSGTPIDTTVIQANWNLDTMDGGADAANPSNHTLDWLKAQIFVIDFQWLSVGRIRFGFEMEGHIHYVHQIDQSNTATIPWCSTPNLPTRYQIITTASSPASTMRCICCSVVSEGGTDDIGVVHRKSTAGAAVTTAVENTLYAIIGIRLKSTHLGTTIKILEAAMQVQTASELIEWVVLFNPTVAGTFTYSDHPNSAVQTALGAGTNTVTGGNDMGGGYIESGGGGSGQGSGQGTIDNTHLLGSAIDGTVDEIVLCARPIGGVSVADLEGALIWREL